MISRAAIHKMVWSHPLAKAAESVGLSANGLAKRCDRLGIPRPSRSYWAKPAAERPPPTRLPDDQLGPSDVPQGAGRRTRLAPADRHRQLLDAAAAVAICEGVQNVTLKRVAREAGISEAQAHNCFQGRMNLLLSLALRELGIVEARRRSRVLRGDDPFARMVISTVSYLHEARERGPLLQRLLRNTDVRAALRSERTSAILRGPEPMVQVLPGKHAMKSDVAQGSVAALTAVVLRAGDLVASGRTELAVAERLCLAIVLAGARSNEAGTGG